MKRAPRIAAIQDISGFGRLLHHGGAAGIGRHGRGMLPAAYRLPLRPHRVSGQREGHLSGSDRPDGGDGGPLGGAGGDL